MLPSALTLTQAYFSRWHRAAHAAGARITRWKLTPAQHRVVYEQLNDVLAPRNFYELEDWTRNDMLIRGIPTVMRDAS